MKQYHKQYSLINDGDYYRLLDLTAQKDISAWEFAAEDGSRALLNIVYMHVRGNFQPPVLHLRGLTPDASYRLTEDNGREIGVWTGAALMNAGFRVPRSNACYPAGATDYAAFQIELERIG